MPEPLRPLPPGTVFYAVLHDTIYTPYGPYSLLYQALAPSTSDILNADPAAFTGALVAAGNFRHVWEAAWLAVCSGAEACLPAAAAAAVPPP